MMPLSITNLTCGYTDTPLLENITLNIESHLSILGANGSGKSTFAKALCGLIPFSGKVELFGQDVRDIALKERAKRISYIPAKLDIYDPYMTLEEFVLLGRFAHKESFKSYSAEDSKIALACIELLKISHLLEHTVASLSSGEQQLAQIAAALAAQSGIIIFDEPTANLDPHNAKIIAEHIKGLKEYHQIILITHDLHLACYVDNPVAFVKNKTLTCHGREFFDDATLEALYGVAFTNLAVRYA